MEVNISLYMYTVHKNMDKEDQRILTFFSNNLNSNTILVITNYLITDHNLLQKNFGLDLLTHSILLSDVQCTVPVAELHPINHSLDIDLGGDCGSLSHRTTGGIHRSGRRIKRGLHHHIRNLSSIGTPLGGRIGDSLYFASEADITVGLVLHGAVVLS